ncbi:MAG TPA: transcriptional regulator [candidate division WOR-3 bacterium]|uniref:Transcriptional regulator n=1 Tax=candidate division WOR-3 bacterium TaxID=2052148 RepID=A0A9C9EN55_UNCW3|nr:transcriptional regulator [candidate division WOR-3 bacterium]
MHYKNNKLKTLGTQAAHLVTTLYEQNRPIFCLKEVQKILRLDEVSSRNFVRKLVNRGVVTRLKPGLFILVPFELGKEAEYIGNPFVVAREIVGGKDYYLSHVTAMEIHGMITQPQLVVYITTLKPRRSITALGIEFRFIHSQKRYFFGLSDHWVTKQEKVRVSDLERTIIDGLKQPEYCGGLTEVAKGLWMRYQDVNINRLTRYAIRIGVGAVIRRLGFLLELYKIGNSEDWEILRSHLTETYVRLDPLLPSEGKFLRKWRIQLNVSPEELLSVVRT